MECKNCERSGEDLLKVKDEYDKVTYICEKCYNSLCEGYRIIEE